MRLTAEMSEEEKRHVAEGLDTEEQLAVFDMLLKPDLSKTEIKKIKSVAVSLLQELERQMREVQGIFDKTATRDRFRQSIYDYLYDDRTGLPAESYGEIELATKTEVIFDYFSRRHRPINAEPVYNQ
jgi:type I restriction enzyme R subunit